jgi:O-methyltransferase domain
MEVIHDWGNAECVATLSTIRRAAAPGATVLVVENVLPDEGIDPRGQTLDVIMLAVTGGKGTDSEPVERALQSCRLRRRHGQRDRRSSAHCRADCCRIAATLLLLSRGCDTRTSARVPMLRVSDSHGGDTLPGPETPQLRVRPAQRARRVRLQMPLRMSTFSGGLALVPGRRGEPLSVESRRPGSFGPSRRYGRPCRRAKAA